MMRNDRMMIDDRLAAVAIAIISMSMRMLRMPALRCSNCWSLVIGMITLTISTTFASCSSVDSLVPVPVHGSPHELKLLYQARFQRFVVVPLCGEFSSMISQQRHCRELVFDTASLSTNEFWSDSVFNSDANHPHPHPSTTRVLLSRHVDDSMWVTVFTFFADTTTAPLHQPYHSIAHQHVYTFGSYAFREIHSWSQRHPQLGIDADADADALVAIDALISQRDVVVQTAIADLVTDPDIANTVLQALIEMMLLLDPRDHVVMSKLLDHHLAKPDDRIVARLDTATKKKLLATWMCPSFELASLWKLEIEQKQAFLKWQEIYSDAVALWPVIEAYRDRDAGPAAISSTKATYAQLIFDVAIDTAERVAKDRICQIVLGWMTREHVSSFELNSDFGATWCSSPTALLSLPIYERKGPTKNDRLCELNKLIVRGHSPVRATRIWQEVRSSNAEIAASRSPRPDLCVFQRSHAVKQAVFSWIRDHNTPQTRSNVLQALKSDPADLHTWLQLILIEPNLASGVPDAVDVLAECPDASEAFVRMVIDHSTSVNPYSGHHDDTLAALQVLYLQRMIPRSVYNSCASVSKLLEGVAEDVFVSSLHIHTQYWIAEQLYASTYPHHRIQFDRACRAMAKSQQYAVPSVRILRICPVHMLRTNAILQRALIGMAVGLSCAIFMLSMLIRSAKSQQQVASSGWDDRAISVEVPAAASAVLESKSKMQVNDAEDSRFISSMSLSPYMVLLLVGGIIAVIALPLFACVCMIGVRHYRHRHDPIREGRHSSVASIIAAGGRKSAPSAASASRALQRRMSQIIEDAARQDQEEMAYTQIEWRNSFRSDSDLFESS